MLFWDVLNTPTVIDRKAKSPLKLTGSEVPLDIDMDDHASIVELEDPDKTVTVPNSSYVAVLSDEKRTTVQRQRSERKKSISSTHSVSKSLVNFHSESQNTLLKSGSKAELHPSVAEKNSISSNIIKQFARTKRS